MKCPQCTAELIHVGFTGSGHQIWRCPECKCRWEIKYIRSDLG